MAVAIGALVKWPCLHHAWDGFQYASLCYSDIQALYHVRGIAAGVMPYVDGFSEYPVLTGMWTYVAGRWTEDAAGYVTLNLVVLGSCAIATTWLLHKMGRQDRLWMWVLSPALVLSVFLNFDMLAVFLATVALYFYRDGRWDLSAAFFGLGAAAKLYPAFLVPVFAGALLRGQGTVPAVRFGAVSFGVWFLVQVPFLIVAPGGWWETYGFHAGRGQEWETLWMIIQHAGTTRGWDWATSIVEPGTMALVSRVVLVAAIGLATLATWRGVLRPEAGSLVVLTAFFLSSPVFNMQYVLWMLPFLVLADVPVRWVAVLFFGDLAVHLTKFHLLWHIGTPEYDDHFVVFAAAVLIRALAFAAILVRLVRPTLDPLLRSFQRSGLHPAE